MSQTFRNFSQRRRWAADQAISFLMQQGVEHPHVVSLAAGLVDPSSLPAAEALEAARAVLSDDLRARSALQYGTTQGDLRLRQQLADYQSRLEQMSTPPVHRRASPNEIVCTTGSQQLLALLADALLDPGDICLVAAPTYFVFLGVLDGVGARTIALPADDHGMRTDALTTELQRLDSVGELSRVKLIYVVSEFENPTGISLSLDRRADLVKIAKHWSQCRGETIYVLEDAAYRELHYDASPLPSVWSFDVAGDTVIHAGTFSKSFSPGLRVGFGLMPRELRNAINDLKGNQDFGSANFNQHLLAELLASGRFATHAEQVRSAYRIKRDAMLAAADEFFADLPGVSWVHPRGGLYVWMTLPSHIATGFDSPLFRRAVEVEQVMYVPGELCFAGPRDARQRNHMRLSFGVQSPAGLREGMRRLSRAVRAILGEPEGVSPRTLGAGWESCRMGGEWRERLATTGSEETRNSAGATGEDVTTKPNNEQQMKLAEELGTAVRHADEKKVQELLAAGVDPNWRDQKGRAALHTMGIGSDSMNSKDIEVAKLLIAAGANVNAFTEVPKEGAINQPVVMLNDGSIPMLKLLIEAGANINSQSTEGGTILHYCAAMDRSVSHTTKILELGADPRIRDASGRTALDSAVQYGSKGVAKALRAWQDTHPSTSGAVASKTAAPKGDSSQPKASAKKK